VKTYDEDDGRIYRGYQNRHRDELLEKRSFLWHTLGYVMNFLSRNCANGNLRLQTRNVIYATGQSRVTSILRFNDKTS
jgi:hypothetical protein